jgi:AraC-like DNA-binding protein
VIPRPLAEMPHAERGRISRTFQSHEDISLAEVMYRVGIQSQSYFSKAFKKEFGKTPTQFLQELKG